MPGYELFEAANKARQAWHGQLIRRYGHMGRLAVLGTLEAMGEPGSPLREAWDALKAAEAAWGAWFDGASPITRAAVEAAEAMPCVAGEAA
ncbi:hypothetical protein V5F38_10340 [Xanthobacter sp. V0B-10]|uniref:hypothetical protein n=1 Tax=Xanthobacter albus TaxID=3119929 RepID=UPI003726596C